MQEQSEKLFYGEFDYKCYIKLNASINIHQAAKVNARAF